MADIVMNMNELHKKVYSKKPMPKVIPEIAKIQKDIEFSNEEKLGEEYQVGVRLSYPNGFTYAAGDGTAGAFALGEVRGGVAKKAKITANQLVLRDHMSYEDAAKATGGEASFVKGTQFFYEGLQLSSRKRLESTLLYGGVGIGEVLTYTAANASYSNQPTIQIKKSEWAPQLWAGCDGADIDVMTGSTATKRATVQIAGVDIETQTVILSAPITGCAAADKIYFGGAYGKEMQGIHSVLSNTGMLFGINAAQYGLWKSITQPVGGAMSFAKLKAAISKTCAKGLYGKINLYVNPGAWDDLATSIEALRVTSEKDIKKVEIGTEEIVYHSQNGVTEIKSHPMVKEGFGYGLFVPTWKRVGSQDLILGAPGFDGTPWFNLPNNAGVEARMYTNQCVFTETPAQNFILTGIVNSN